jgi:hypothetical protein
VTATRRFPSDGVLTSLGHAAGSDGFALGRSTGAGSRILTRPLTRATGGFSIAAGSVRPGGRRPAEAVMSGFWLYVGVRAVVALSSAAACFGVDQGSYFRIDNALWVLACVLLFTVFVAAALGMWVLDVESPARGGYERRLAAGVLACLAVTHGLSMFHTDQTYDLVRVLVQCLLCVAAVQMLAWSDDVGEVYWKGSDYVWLVVAVCALLGGLQRVRAEMIGDGAEAYRRMMAAARSRVLGVLDWPAPGPRGPAAEDPPAAPSEWQRRDREYRDWLRAAFRKLAADRPEWGSDDLARALAGPPPGSDVLARARELAEAAAALKQQELARDWYLHARQYTEREKAWLNVSALALTLAIGLRLGKTSAEVRKLRLERARKRAEAQTPNAPVGNGEPGLNGAPGSTAAKSETPPDDAGTPPAP